MRLFAERGFRSTGVGDVEAAAGLEPRRGALYKHFPSKQALLEAAVRRELANVAIGAAQIDALNLTTARRADRSLMEPVVTGLGRWFLGEMDRLEDLTRMVEHDGRRMGLLTGEVKTSIVDLSYRTAARLIADVAPEADDPEAIAVVLLGALVALRRTAWTFGSPPLDLDDDRVLAVWTQVALATLGALTATTAG